MGASSEGWADEREGRGGRHRKLSPLDQTTRELTSLVCFSAGVLVVTCQVTVVRCEEINISGSFFRNKVSTLISPDRPSSRAAVPRPPSHPPADRLRHTHTRLALCLVRLLYDTHAQPPSPVRSHLAVPRELDRNEQTGP